MKIKMIHFSGTGNTKYIATYLGDKLKANNHNVSISSIEENPTIEKDIDLLVVGGPIYAGNVPEKLIRWINKNIPNSNANCIVYTTSVAAGNAYGVDSLAKKLAKKGYNILAKEVCLMPGNLYFGKYHQFSRDEINETLLNINKKLDELAIKIHLNNFENTDFENKGVLVKDFLADTFSVMAKFIGKNFSADDTCVKCGLCIKSCPQGNIHYDKNNNIKFSNKCMMCTRCIHICPKNAINYKGVKYDQYSLFE